MGIYSYKYINKGMAEPVQIVLEGDPYLNFINSLKSTATRKAYRDALIRFMEHFKIKDTIILSQLLPKDIEQYLRNHIEYLKEQKRSTRSMDMILSAVQHFCVMNDIVINYNKISKFKSPAKTQNTDKAYTHSDLQKLINVSPLRVKVMILIYASTGIRRSALPALQLKQLKKIENLYKITIYEGEKEQYYTFCTPECAFFMDEYLDYRTRSGENLTDESYLIRQDFDINDLEQIKKRSRPITDKTMASSILVCLVKAGLREINRESQFVRKSIPLLHGFRKVTLPDHSLSTHKRCQELRSCCRKKI